MNGTRRESIREKTNADSFFFSAAGPALNPNEKAAVVVAAGLAVKLCGLQILILIFHSI